jgi:hypothetical protein
MLGYPYNASAKVAALEIERVWGVLTTSQNGFVLLYTL